MSILSWSNRQDVWQLFPDRPHIGQIQLVTNLKASQSIEYFAEYVWECFCGEKQISWSITLIIEKLSEEFPKHLAVHGSQDRQQASAAHEIQQRKRTPNLEFPWRK